EECPNPWTAVRERWYLLIPLIGLIILLFSGYTPLFSGTIGLGLTVILIFGSAIIKGASNMAVRYLFWVLLGFACSGFLEFGVMAFFVIIALLAAVLLARHNGIDTIKLAIASLADGARNALPVAAA